MSSSYNDIHGTWLIPTCNMMGHDSFLRVTWSITMCDMTHAHGWNDSFTCGTWLILTWDMTHSYVWHEALLCVTRHIPMGEITHSYVGRDSFLRVTWLTLRHEPGRPSRGKLPCVTWLIHMWDMTQSHVGHDSITCGICDWELLRTRKQLPTLLVSHSRDRWVLAFRRAL